MDNFDRTEYKNLVAQRATKSPIVQDCLLAFLIGGLICAAGEGLLLAYAALGTGAEAAPTLVSVTLIFLTALFTGLGVFDRVAKYAGAGTLVPITGFANAVVSPAIDDKAEGYVNGVGAKIFVIAGPVILYGTLSGAVYGVVYYLVTRFI